MPGRVVKNRSGVLTQIAHALQAVDLTVQIGIQAGHDQRAAESCRLGSQCIGGHPVRGENALIEWLLGQVFDDAADKGESQIGLVFVRHRPKLSSNEVVNADAVGRFLKGFAHRCFDQRFIFFEMSGGLIEDRALAARLLLNDEKSTLLLDDGRDRDVGKK